MQEVVEVPTKTELLLKATGSAVLRAEVELVTFANK
jgi:hypothetical protein